MKKSIGKIMKNTYILVGELYEAYIFRFSKQLYNYSNNNFVCIKTNLQNATGKILIERVLK